MMPMKLSTRRIVVCGAPEIVASVRLLSEAARTTTRNGGVGGSRPYVHAQLGNPCTPIQHGSGIGNHYEPAGSKKVSFFRWRRVRVRPYFVTGGRSYPLLAVRFRLGCAGA